jgi:hypothetical protein
MGVTNGANMHRGNSSLAFSPTKAATVTMGCWWNLQVIVAYDTMDSQVQELLDAVQAPFAPNKSVILVQKVGGHPGAQYHLMI